MKTEKYTCKNKKRKNGHTHRTRDREEKSTEHTENNNNTKSLRNMLCVGALYTLCECADPRESTEKWSDV